MENRISGTIDTSATTSGNPKRFRVEEIMSQQEERITKVFGKVFTEAMAPLIKTLNNDTNKEPSAATDNISGSSGSNQGGDNIDTYQQQSKMIQSMNLLNSIKTQIDSIKESINEISKNTEDFERKKK